EKVELITSMYMLHEFGRDGNDAIVRVLQAIGHQLPGRLLLALEVEGCNPMEFNSSDAGHKGRLDYQLIHVISAQGLPKRPEEWHDLFKKAGFSIINPGVRSGGSYIYTVKT